MIEVLWNSKRFHLQMIQKRLIPPFIKTIVLNVTLITRIALNSNSKAAYARTSDLDYLKKSKKHHLLVEN